MARLTATLAEQFEESERLIPRLWEIINAQMRAFAGMTVFEELCREWVLRQAIRGALPFLPDRPRT